MPKIIESEAKTVRLIYKMFLEGTAATTIARYLRDNNIPSPSGKKVWSVLEVFCTMKNIREMLFFKKALR
ncbi:recombinase family protein [Clostridium sp. ZBS12]|uniref:recombinase family protein n=1 Tax=Clostridium sp. ZBS12 TaxID=2949972 RepID=UPI00207AFCFD|nr:recombinase family protein [Clostridium sp. ZBS12]